MAKKGKPTDVTDLFLKHIQAHVEPSNTLLIARNKNAELRKIRGRNRKEKKKPGRETPPKMYYGM